MGMMQYTDPMSLNPPVSVVGTGNPELDQSGEGQVTETGDPQHDPIGMQYPGDTVAELDQSNNGIMGYDKYLKPQLSQEIIGIQSPRLIISDTAWTPTQTTFDTSTYYDRAVVKLRNEAGSTKTLHAFGIAGLLVVRVAGKNGYVWEASNYDDIERNGELDYKLGNEFVVNGTQIESIGDWLQKELRPHDMYKLYLKGCHPYYEEGDLYTLDVSYTVNGAISQTEEIDIDVQICGVSITREVGQLGQTVLSVRVPTGAWSKTTTMRARLLTAGLPFGTLARGGTIKVAASTYTGTDAHYYCDGTDDQVEIHAALKCLGEIGGGMLLLTRGVFNTSYSNYGLEDACITLGPDNISIVGEGMENTIIRHDCIADDYRYIIAILSSNVQIYNVAIEATGTYVSKSYGILVGSDTDNAKITYSKITAARCIADGYGANSGLSVIECIGIVKNADIAGNSRFVSLSDCSNTVISKNVVNIEDVGASGGAAIGIWINEVCTGGSIEGNLITLNGSDSASSCAGIVITDVTSSNFTIMNNIIRFLGSYATVGYGISVNGDNGTISSNTIQGADFNDALHSYGIIVLGDNNVISNNNIRAVTNPGAGTGYGIYVGGDRTNVSGNISLSCDTNYQDAGTNTAATGNITS
jgi:hypothetical protein